MSTQRQVAALFFGGYYRLLVWIHHLPEPHVFWQGQFYKDTRHTDSDLRKHLMKLQQLGMIEEMPPNADIRRKYWRRLPSPRWRVIEAFMQAEAELEYGAHGVPGPDAFSVE